MNMFEGSGGGIDVGNLKLYCGYANEGEETE